MRIRYHPSVGLPRKRNGYSFPIIPRNTRCLPMSISSTSTSICDQLLADHAVDRTGNLTEMQEAVHAPEIDEGAMGDDIANSSPYSVPGTQLSQELSLPLIPIMCVVEAFPSRRKIA
jgi:hypothetical protein